MKNDYAYAAARIRVRELSLLNRQALEQLLEARTADEVLRRLTDQGWGDSHPPQNEEELLRCEEKKTWQLMEELLADVSVLDPLKMKTDYQNLKAAVKLSVSGTSVPKERFFRPGGRCSPEELLACAREGDYRSLPGNMASAGEEARRVLLRTGDGQLCDTLLDRAWMDELYAAGTRTGEEALRQYAVLTVAAADIRTAVRCARTGKSGEFMERALAPVRELDTEALAAAALSGQEQIEGYLETTEFVGAAEALRISDAAFETWCAGELMERLKPQKAESFTAGPLAAYILARENEIRYVRIIFSGKQNHLPGEKIRERLGALYV